MKYKRGSFYSTNTQPVNLNSFDVISVIGKGSYAKVLLVRKKDTGKLYAMKVLKKENIVKSQQENHIMTERNILVNTDASPFIVKLHYTFQTDRKLYFVLEYCSGGELFSILQRCRRLTEEKAKFYAAQIVLALEHLHKHNVVYRDLKPENVLISETGYIKLADFGLSRMNVTQNEARTLCGTPEYLAPEILLNKGYGKAVDWWTFGNILYEMLIGITPFYTQQRSQLYDRIKEASPRFPAFISQSARNLVEVLLQKKPEERMGTQNGATEIKEHPWFADMDWNKMEQQLIEPVYLPSINEDMGLDNFDSDFTKLPLQSVDVAGEHIVSLKNFDDFDWNSEDVILEENTDDEDNKKIPNIAKVGKKIHKKMMEDVC